MSKLSHAARIRVLAACAVVLALAGATMSGATIPTASASTLFTAADDDSVETVDRPRRQSTNTAPAARGVRLRFGAISLNVRDGAYGYGNDYLRKRPAIRAGQRSCRSRSRHPRQCRKLLWVRNGCASVAVRWGRGGSVHHYGLATGFRTRAVAARKARSKCGPRCRTRVTICTTRYY